MRLTHAAEYAVRCVACLAAAPPGSPTTRRAVARRMDIPESFLGKIAPLLAKAEILELIRGPKGGLRLARPASEITLLDAVEAVIGPISLNDCVLRPESCGRSPTCLFHRVWNRANEQLRATLATCNFESLVTGDPGMRDLAEAATASGCHGTAKGYT